VTVTSRTGEGQILVRESYRQHIPLKHSLPIYYSTIWKIYLGLYIQITFFNNGHCSMSGSTDLLIVLYA